MYTGELINYSMVVLWNPTTWNLVLLGVIISFLFLRIRLEERTVHDYDQYATRVRWRIVPYVW